jgi:hypothetical protein
MIFIPGPGVLGIFAGIAILATEFPWAQRVLDRFKHQFHTARERFKHWRAQRSES